MASVQEHYENVLSDVYSWMYGGFENAIQRNIDFFKKHSIRPHGNGKALDLGAGSGFQSIPLAQAGYTVTAIDFDAKLLTELKKNADALPITTVQDDMLNFNEYVSAPIELAVCMTDTILHLASKEKVAALFKQVYQALENDGKFIITFRDMTYELKEADRFLAVRSDEKTIFTCFLEYEEETVKVHDIVYTRSGDAWHLSKSFYRKLRLSEAWMQTALTEAGFTNIHSETDKGFITLIAQR